LGPAGYDVNANFMHALSISVFSKCVDERAEAALILYRRTTLIIISLPEHME
jgi:hypothetical protein